MSPRSTRLECCRIDTNGGRNGVAGGRIIHVEGGIRNDVDRENGSMSG